MTYTSKLILAIGQQAGEAMEKLANAVMNKELSEKDANLYPGDIVAYINWENDCTLSSFINATIASLQKDLTKEMLVVLFTEEENHHTHHRTIADMVHNHLTYSGVTCITNAGCVQDDRSPQAMLKVLLERADSMMVPQPATNTEPPVRVNPQ